MGSSVRLGASLGKTCLPSTFQIPHTKVTSALLCSRPPSVPYGQVSCRLQLILQAPCHFVVVGRLSL